MDKRENNLNTTPMMRQYASIKEKHREAVLFFRMGDFYEMFQSDAVEVSQLLGLTLTKRGGVPMCGIPYHAYKGYIGKLLKMGKKVAICEQTELPQKGLAKREVVEIITPGTITDEGYLEKNANNYLVAIGVIESSLSFAYSDLSTGEFTATAFPFEEGEARLRRELYRLSPGEIIVQDELYQSQLQPLFREISGSCTVLPDWSFDLLTAQERIKRHFAVASLKAFGFQDNSCELISAGVLLEYLEENARSLLPHIRQIRRIREKDFVLMDESTQKNLEIVRNLQDNTAQNTLLEVIDYTKTAMGGRALRNWLLRPSRSLKEIEERHNRVESLFRRQKELSQLRTLLSGIFDIERLATRVAMERAHGKDLVAIRDSLSLIKEIDSFLKESGLEELAIADDWKSLSQLWELLEKSLCDEPSILLTEGRLIKEGYNSEVDRLRKLRENSRAVLNEYLESEKRRTGISSLKIRYNKIIGYFFEVTKSNLSQIPKEYIRRQTLVGSERLTTERLGEIEVEINSAAERSIELERELFLTIRREVKQYISQLQKSAALIGVVDVLQGFAYAATVRGYSKPLMTDRRELLIKRGRHPVVEAMLPSGEFISNDLEMSPDRYFSLITGPNMAGKSTYLRQTALLLLMAQAGSFIPAEEAKIGLVDQIFCRVGASDNLARGESTFLVEMHETAYILRNGTDRSLIIMDEVGRGTGTKDGLSLAKAVLEYIESRLKSRTLFATHFHELTETDYPGLFNLSMEVREERGKILFLRRVKPGPTKASYGIHVASLAGIPEDVVENAKKTFIEMINEPQYADNSVNSRAEKNLQGVLFTQDTAVTEKIRETDPDKLTPLEALELVYKWKKMLKES